MEWVSRSALRGRSREECAHAAGGAISFNAGRFATSERFRDTSATERAASNGLIYGVPVEVTKKELAGVVRLSGAADRLHHLFERERTEADVLAGGLVQLASVAADGVGHGS